MRGVADAQQARPVPPAQPVHPHLEEAGVVPALAARRRSARRGTAATGADRRATPSMPAASQRLVAALGHRGGALPVRAAVDDREQPRRRRAARRSRPDRPMPLGIRNHSTSSGTPYSLTARPGRGPDHGVAPVAGDGQGRLAAPCVPSAPGSARRARRRRSTIRSVTSARRFSVKVGYVRGLARSGRSGSPTAAPSTGTGSCPAAG